MNGASALLCVLGSVVIAGCGDDAGSEGAAESLVCQPGTFALSGTLGGEPISHRGNLDGHVWVQGSDESMLTAIFEGGGSFDARWDGVIADGDSTAIRGTIALPSSGPRGGSTLDGDSGSMTKRDDGVTFELTALSESVACITAPCPADEVDGTLQGCVEWEPISF